MKMAVRLTDETILSELGQRLERHRIGAALTQAQLAREAGVAKRTLERIESGNGCELTTLIRVLRVLKLLDELDALIPELPSSPIDLLMLQGRKRQRVRSPRLKARVSKTTNSAQTDAEKGVASRGSAWKWGE